MKSTEIKELMSAFEQATTLSITFVALPVVFLFIGVFIDKALSTTPVFILLGIVVGVCLGAWRMIDISKKYKKVVKKEHENG